LKANVWVLGYPTENDDLELLDVRRTAVEEVAAVLAVALDTA